MDHSTFKELYAQTIGMEILNSLSGEDVLEALARKADAEALQVVSEIRAVLNNEDWTIRPASAALTPLWKRSTSTASAPPATTFEKARPARKRRAGPHSL